MTVLGILFLSRRTPKYRDPKNFISILEFINSSHHKKLSRIFFLARPATYGILKVRNIFGFLNLKVCGTFKLIIRGQRIRDRVSRPKQFYIFRIYNEFSSQKNSMEFFSTRRATKIWKGTPRPTLICILILEPTGASDHEECCLKFLSWQGGVWRVGKDTPRPKKIISYHFHIHIHLFISFSKSTITTY